MSMNSFINDFNYITYENSMLQLLYIKTEINMSNKTQQLQILLHES